MLRRKSFSFSRKQHNSSSVSPPPISEDLDGSLRDRVNSDSQATFRRGSERKSFRKLKDFIGGHKEKNTKREDLKSKISNPIPVHVRRYGVDNTDYITGLPTQPEENVKVVPVEDEINGFYNSLPRPRKSTPNQIAIISGKTSGNSNFSRSASIRSSTSYHSSTLPRTPMHSKQRRMPPLPQDDKHSSVSSEESGVSVGYEGEDAHRLDKCKWFHGIVKPTHADKTLKSHGDFLVRENVSGTPLYYTSVFWDNSVHHIPVKMSDMFSGSVKSVHKYSFDEGAFDSVPQLIHAHIKYKIPIEPFSNILLLNPVTKSNPYEDIDNTEQSGKTDETTWDEGRNSGYSSASDSPELKGHRAYSASNQRLVERDARSRSVPTSVANNITKGSDRVQATASVASLREQGASTKSKVDEDTYMEMSSVQSSQVPPDFRCDSQPTRAATYSSSGGTPEPPYSRGSTPRLHSSTMDLSRSKTSPKRSPKHSPYSSSNYASSSRKVYSGLLCHAQSTTSLEAQKYDISTTVTNSGKGLLNEAAVQTIVTRVLETSTDQLAFHTTLADAVCFKVLPYPGEPEEAWWSRMRDEGSMNGLLAGLEVLGSTHGEKLWNTLWLRHHVLSQWVVLCLTSMQYLKTRTKLLSKFVELARTLQGARYANVFSFMAIMDGLSSSQVFNLRKTWESFHEDYPDLSQSYADHLTGVYAQVHRGDKVFALEYVTIPSIQQLGEAFLPKVNTYSPKHYGRGDTKDLLTGLDHFAQGFSQLREMLQHCPTFHWNAKKKLSGTAINLDLYHFFMRDHPKELLQQMQLEVSLENTSQRRRMFNHILEILSDIAESPQANAITSS